MRFRPHPDFKKLLYLYLALFLVPFLAVILLLALAVRGPILGVLILLLLVVAPPAIFAAFWIERYYDSISFELTDTEIIDCWGVWFKHTTRLPYSKVMNIDTRQGPISRRLDLWDIHVHTAGYGGSKGGLPEVRIWGLKADMKDRVMNELMSRVRGMRPTLIEEAPRDVSLEILDELRRIRRILEESKLA